MEHFFSHSLTSLLWLVLLLLLISRAFLFSRPIAGIGLCHWFSQAINHFFGELFISQNTSFSSSDREYAQIGYQISAWAVLALIMAQLTVMFFDSKSTWFNNRINSFVYDLKIGYVAIVYGLVCYFFLSGILSFIPSITSILSGGLAMASGGLAWLYIATFKSRGSFPGLVVASFMFVFPAFTLVLNGYMGYGIQAILGVAGVVVVTHKPRWVVFLLAPFLLYLGFSLYPSYMASRGEIREKVWGNADFVDRFQATFGGIYENWQWFDPNDDKQMEALNGRLNQNILVGSSCQYIESGNVNFGGGDTIIDGVLALIPRAIWPEKPLSAGSNGLVTRYTGIKFSEGTSVGIGNIMEFYVNFGVFGVFAGFYIIGLAVYFLDSFTGYAIQNNIPVLFLACFVPGQSLMNSIGSFVEWGPSLVGSIVLVWTFNRFFATYAPVRWSRS